MWAGTSLRLANIAPDHTQPVSEHSSVCVCVCVCVFAVENADVGCVCVQLVVCVELLVSTVQMTRCCSPPPDIHTNLVQIVQQLARDVHVFWQV